MSLCQKMYLLSLSTSGVIITSLVLGITDVSADGFADPGLEFARVKTPYSDIFAGSSSAPIQADCTCLFSDKEAFNGCPTWEQPDRISCPSPASITNMVFPHDHDTLSGCDSPTDPFERPEPTSGYTQYGPTDFCPETHAFALNTTWESTDSFWVYDANLEAGAGGSARFRNHGPPHLSLPRVPLIGNGLMHFEVLEWAPGGVPEGFKRAFLGFDLNKLKAVAPGSDPELHENVWGGQSLPYMQFGAAKNRGNQVPIARTRTQAAGQWTIKFGFRLHGNQSSGIVGSRMVFLTEPVDGIPRGIQLELVARGIELTPNKATWNWPFRDHYFYPGVDWIMLDRDGYNSCVSNDLPIIQEETDYQLEIPIDDLFACAQQLIGYDGISGIPADTEITVVAWNIEAASFASGEFLVSIFDPQVGFMEPPSPPCLGCP